MMGRFGGADFGGNEFDQEGGEDGMMMHPGSHQVNQHKITVNLEDAVLEEQKLFQILEVRRLLRHSFNSPACLSLTLFLLNPFRFSLELTQQFERFFVLR